MYKVAQTWFVLHETWYTKLFGIYYCVEVVRIENHSHMLEIYVLSCNFMGLSSFGTFAHKVAQTLFVLQQTWHISVFAICYCVKVV